MTLSRFDVDGLFLHDGNVDPFARAIIHSKEPYLGPFNRNTQYFIVAHALDELEGDLSGYGAGPATDVARKAVSLATRFRGAIPRHYNSRMSEMADACEDPEAREEFLTALGNAERLSRLSNEYLSEGDYKGAERCAKKAGRKLDRKRVRAQSIKFLSGPPSELFDRGVAGFDYLKAPMVLTDEEAAGFFRGTRTFYQIRVSERDIPMDNIHAAEKRLMRDNKNRLLRYAAIALKNNNPLAALKFITEHSRNKEGRYYLERVREVRDACFRLGYVGAACEISEGRLREKFPARKAYARALRMISSERTHVFGLSGIRYLISKADDEELRRISRDLDRKTKEAEVRKNPTVLYANIMVKRKIGDNRALARLVGLGIKVGIYNNRDAIDSIAPEESKEELYRLLPVPEKREKKAEEPEPPRFDEKMKTIFSEEEVLSLYRQRGLDGVKERYKRALSEIGGDEISGGIPSYLSYPLGVLRAKHIELTQDEKESSGTEMFHRGEFHQGRQWFREAGKTPSRDLVLIGLLTNTMNHPEDTDVLINTLKEQDMEVPPMLHVVAGMKNLGYACRTERSINGPRFELDGAYLYAAWQSFKSSGDVGLVEFIERNFPEEVRGFEGGERTAQEIGDEGKKS